jgi:hypothetical protein
MESKNKYFIYALGGVLAAEDCDESRTKGRTPEDGK